jgi:hypothetical protein
MPKNERLPITRVWYRPTRKSALCGILRHCKALQGRIGKATIRENRKVANQRGKTGNFRQDKFNCKERGRDRNPLKQREGGQFSEDHKK